MFFEFFPQAGNCGFDRIAREFIAELGQGVFELALLHNPADLSHQDFQDGSFARSQSKVNVSASRNPCRCVKAQLSGDERRRESFRRASQQGAAASEKFAMIERLDQIIVGARIEPGDPVVNGSAGGQHENGGIDVLSPHGADQVESVAIGQS